LAVVKGGRYGGFGRRKAVSVWERSEGGFMCRRTMLHMRCMMLKCTTQRITSLEVRVSLVGSPHPLIAAGLAQMGLWVTYFVVNLVLALHRIYCRLKTGTRRVHLQTLHDRSTRPGNPPTCTCNPYQRVLITVPTRTLTSQRQVKQPKGRMDQIHSTIPLSPIPSTSTR
jgi:hypothetical protein